jgi:protein-tyrosine phosphatase
MASRAADSIPFNFGPAAAGEEIVFGARRPGYPLSRAGRQPVEDWIAFMLARGIRRVVCLLDAELSGYDDLLGDYRRAFGPQRVCHAPIPDFRLADPPTLLDVILPFLDQADARGEKTVVHCAGGSGRTGHVLAAWLVHGRGYAAQAALAAVRHAPGVRRNPCEAVDDDQALARLAALLAAAARPG